MREIKFRAWYPAGRSMLNGIANRCVITFEGKLLVVDNISGSYIAPQDYILMQYTNLKDKNGEIYEGDVVQVLGMELVVTWYGGAGAWWVNGKDDGFGKMTLSEALQKGGEVIGNIYENPELLK